MATTMTTSTTEIPLSRAERRALARAERRPGAPRRQPKNQLRDPVGYVVEGLTPLTEQEGGKYITTWKIRMHGAMREVLRGQARKGDMNDLVAGWNITSALCNIHGLEDPALLRGKQALIDLCARSNQLQRVVAKAHEIQALNDLIQLHDEWIESITVRQMEDALAWCKRHENQGHTLRGDGIPR
jgi:hypothetical protein